MSNADKFMDIDQMFSELFNSENKEVKKEENKNCYPYGKCEMCWSQGSFVGKIIPDSKNVPFRKIEKAYLGKVPFPKDEGEGTYNYTINAIASHEYRCELTEEQRKLNDEFISEINKNIELSNSLNIRPLYKMVPKVTIFYMMIRRYINLDKNIEEYTQPEVTVMVHRSFNFLKSVTNSVEDRSANLADRSWISDYFNRNPGFNTKFVSIKTSRPNIAYELVTDWLELPKLGYDVTQEQIDRCNDLNNEIININSFDEDLMKKALESIKKVNDDMESSGVGNMSDYVPPTENN